MIASEIFIRTNSARECKRDYFQCLWSGTGKKD